MLSTTTSQATVCVLKHHFAAGSHHNLSGACRESKHQKLPAAIHLFNLLFSMLGLQPWMKIKQAAVVKRKRKSLISFCCLMGLKSTFSLAGLQTTRFNKSGLLYINTHRERSSSKGMSKVRIRWNNQINVQTSENEKRRNVKMWWEERHCLRIKKHRGHSAAVTGLQQHSN